MGERLNRLPSDVGASELNGTAAREENCNHDDRVEKNCFPFVSVHPRSLRNFVSKVMNEYFPDFANLDEPSLQHTALC